MSLYRTSVAVFSPIFLITLIGLLGVSWGQCHQANISINSQSGRLCAENSYYVLCSSLEQPIRVYRDGEEIFNGTSLSAALLSRATVNIQPSPFCENVTLLRIHISKVIVEDTGNYMCRTSSFESEVRHVAIVPSTPACDITLQPGPFVQATQNATFLCSSRTGNPQWTNIESHLQTSVANINSSLSILTLQTSLNMTTHTFTCTVTSECPDSHGGTRTFTSVCNQGIRVVKNPLSTYLSLTQAVLTITVGQSAMYFCETYLSGTTVSLISLDPALNHVKHTTISDSTDEITFFNLTRNYTEPIVECRLLYDNVTITSTVGRIVVLPSTKDVFTTPSTPSIQPSTRIETTVMTTSDTILSPTITPTYVNDTVMMNTSTPATTRSGSSSNPYDIDLRSLVGGLVAGVIVFIIIIVGLSLFFRWRVKKRDEWNVGMISSRRGRGEVATDGEVVGKLEWETDTNPLVELDASTTFSNDHQDQTVVETESDIKPVANGHITTHDKAHLISVDVVIENGTSSPVHIGANNKGFVNDDPTTYNHAQENHVSQKKTDETPYLSDKKNGQRIPKDQNDEDSKGRKDKPEKLSWDDESNEVDIEVFHFIDATKIDGGHSYRDGDSGFGLSPESVLSEIEEGAINIVTV